MKQLPDELLRPDDAPPPVLPLFDGTPQTVEAERYNPKFGEKQYLEDEKAALKKYRQGIL